MGFPLHILLACLFFSLGNHVTMTLPKRPPVKYEEYFIEHEISSSQARNSAITIDLDAVIAPAGCQACTKAEITYCLGRDLINDHCCCDKRYEEVLPYVPHTCYLGTKLCKPVMGDCAQYSRLKECCCDKYVKQFWKESFTSTSTRIATVHGVIYASLVLATRNF